MTRVSSIFSQMLQLFSRAEFERAVVEHRAERHARGFTCWGQFVATRFNADGTSIYLTMAVVFIAKATGIQLSLMDLLVILAVPLFTSKGSAGVAGAGFVALAATLSSMSKIPVAALVLLLGIDRTLKLVPSPTLSATALLRLPLRSGKVSSTKPELRR